MEENDIRLTFPAMFDETLRKFGNHNAYAFVGEEPKTYETVNKEIRSLIAFLEKNRICPGDKVAILSLNMPNWGIAFFSITFMGAVAVPILPDFQILKLPMLLNIQAPKLFLYSPHYYHELKDINQKILKQLFLLRIFH